MTPALQACDVHRSHGATSVLRGCSLELDAGQAVALLGPSGCGKTTLLQILGLLDRPSAGQVLVAGQDPWQARPADRARLRLERLGFVFQRNNLLPHLTALDNVALPAWRRGGDRARARATAAGWLERLGLGHRAQAPARTLSVGEAQRAAIARALINQPLVVIADEATGSLDSVATEGVLSALDQVIAHGAALIVATHDLHVAAHFSRTLSMRDGQLLDHSMKGNQ